MFKFENLHKNHKLAYLDGILSGVVITIIVTGIVKEYRETKRVERMMEETETTTSSK